MVVSNRSDTSQVLQSSHQDYVLNLAFDHYGRRIAVSYVDIMFDFILSHSSLMIYVSNIYLCTYVYVYLVSESMARLNVYRLVELIEVSKYGN